ncbi:hypothetical protein JY651_13835 [Pyxidicoccus parkwayensis]|uniref:Uncharacterized protein n=1 Tax=Pyxidicoccus parkwayensis TaxID=2813578 RepID=A0ABX7P643_9BACT|nr:hypothetical protein [Pyxidicoccus parkwaysis]QSQ25939.1 hypothetical protein JY651_13835 [Pyxidicoccus parkwaysis]
MLKRDDVILGIDLAFKDAAIPRTEEALAPPGIEARYVIDHFFGKTRDDVESQTFPGSLYMEDFSYMTEAAVLYYLPAVLRIMLANSTDFELWIHLHGFLRRLHGDYPNPALTALSVAQRKAIADWADTLSQEWVSSKWMSRFVKEAARLARSYRSAGT